MKITNYETKFNEDRTIILVKEKTTYYTKSTYVSSAEVAANIIETIFDASNQTEEHMWLIALNGARKVAGAFEVTHGLLTSSPVHPREIFTRAMLAGAASIIIAHNHPSGSLEISPQDREVTRRIKEAGEIIGIPLDDHIIIADGDFTSAL